MVLELQDLGGLENKLPRRHEIHLEHWQKLKRLYRVAPACGSAQDELPSRLKPFVLMSFSAGFPCFPHNCQRISMVRH